ncbi:hypothetical protein EJV47_13430 [Hymenobacter gummosus]|uniref:Antitoxin VbhA domain-containing protein n=1 Tax=Hymenobacter gummosus TaxID=1776032 RepID=A0A3S0QHI7_9BACT|nr:hypothetical protein [Hymenobacter gummosus]RTQ49144.1 hypothetical protein EJV47_13430 [Hymenobacter gummosus]
MESKYFRAIPADLPEDEQAARRKRQNHAEWGIAVAALGGTLPAASILTELQRYIDGELTIEDLAGLGHPPRPETKAFDAVVQRERLSRAA